MSEQEDCGVLERYRHEEVHKHHREVMRRIFASDERREVKRVV